MKTIASHQLSATATTGTHSQGNHVSLRNLLHNEELEKILQENPKQANTLGYDPWGFNDDVFRPSLTVLKWLYDHYFRVETFGLENVPKEGRAFIIGNHSGQLPIDGLLVGTAIATNPNGPRIPRAMIERFFPTVPWVGNFLHKCGGVIGDPINCEKMLENEEAVIVFPEGVRGSGKTYDKRYQLQRMGNGFVRLAIKTGSPIIPVGIVGCEETIPSFGNIKPLAKLIGFPYVPMALPVVLPAKVFIHFGKPMYLEGDLDNDDEMNEKVVEVCQELIELIEEGLEKREGIFS